MQNISILTLILSLSVDILSSEHPREITVISQGKETSIKADGESMVVDGVTRTKWQCSKDSFTLIWGDKRRAYKGTLEVTSDKGELVLVNDVDEDSYLSSVVGAEMLPGTPLEALKAQAVLCRTFIHTATRHGEEQWDFCDLTHCQSYKGLESATALTSKAVSETRGLILAYQDKPCQVFYHSTCGGKTADARSIWPDQGAPYLVSVTDEYCRPSPHSQWQYKVSLENVAKVLGLSGVSDVEVTGVSPDSRVREIRVVGSATVLYNGWDFRDIIAKQEGWGTIKSSWFEIQRGGPNLLFKGRGLGHGVGLCQWGAKGMAEKGKSFNEILSHYFPGTEVEEWR